MPHTPSRLHHLTAWSLALLLVACGGGSDTAAPAQASATRESPANVQGDPIYRFAKISSGAYFYTGSQWEADNIRDTLPDFRYEGIAFYQSAQASGTPVYRFANTANGGYFYTASAWERDNTIANYPNMRYEGSTFSVAPAGDPAAAPVYRVANLQNGAYLYTTNPAERDAAVALGFWRDEGSTFAARTTPSDVTHPGPVDDSYPTGLVTVVVPYAAGSATDRIARSLAATMNQQQGRNWMVVENLGGAGGTLAANRVVGSSADGRTILISNGMLSALPALYRTLQFSLDDLTPAGLFHEIPMLVAGAPGLPVTSHGDLRNWLQANQGTAAMGNSGMVTMSYLCSLQYLAVTQVNLTKVPYRGSSPAITDLMGNYISLLCESSQNLATHIENNRLKAIGITSTARLGDGLGQVPTFTEQGEPTMRMSDWHGLYVPKGTPETIVNKINVLLREAMQDPTYVAQLNALRGFAITDERLTPAGHKAFLATEAVRWATLIQAAGQYAD